MTDSIIGSIENFDALPESIQKQLRKVEASLAANAASERINALSEQVHDDVNERLDGFDLPEGFGVVVTHSETGGFCVNLVLSETCDKAIAGKPVGGGGGGNGGAWQHNQYKVVATGEVYKGLHNALHAIDYTNKPIVYWMRWRNVKMDVADIIVREDFDKGTTFADAEASDVPAETESSDVPEEGTSETETVQEGESL